MKRIFNEGEFNQYKVNNLEEARKPVMESFYEFAQAQITVFISHKHSDLEQLKGIIGFLEKEYNVKTYIDSRDPSMPKSTNGVTATRIKDRIFKCHKFILLATNGAIESKWCNWELGYGDAQKFEKKCIALFPMKPEGESDSLYKGNEYMQIYPYIVYYDQNERYKNGEPIQKGYYVCTHSEEGITIEPLRRWLNR